MRKMKCLVKLLRDEHRCDASSTAIFTREIQLLDGDDSKDGIV
jgi:hypothetical protein